MNFIPPFLLGFLATSCQIFLLREFCVHFYGNEMSFGFVLAAWLLWGGVGSVAASRFHFNLNKLARVYLMVVCLFSLCLVGLRFSRFILGILPGEITGIIPILGFSLALTFFISFPLGVLFVFNSHLLQGNVAGVYFLESLGAAVSGLLVYLLLIPYFSNWQGAGIIGIITLILVFIFRSKAKKFPLFLAVLVLLAGFVLIDLPSQKVYWKPFNLVWTSDTPYGKLQVIKTKEQISVYDNNLLVYSYPDLAAAEESVHFAFLQNPLARRALLIGGGAGGGLGQCLKYPSVSVDYVELDPEIIRLSERFLPEPERRVLASRRAHFYYQDGRRFLDRVQKAYDLIILNLPEPATAQINRFYTREFFVKVRSKLTPNGVFSFRLPSAENYISPQLREFLGTLHSSLKAVFPTVKVVPGDTNIFLSSSAPLTIDPEELSQRITQFNLQNTYVSPQMLFARLNSFRVERLKNQLEKETSRLNLDLVPVGTYNNAVLWSTQFKSGETKLLQLFSRLSSFWLLDFPLLLALGAFIFFRLKPTPASRFLVPISVMGMTTIVAEVCVIIAFQTFHGYVYGKIALLLTLFMAGLFVGAGRGLRRKKLVFQQLLFIQFGLVLLLFLFANILIAQPPEILMFAFLLALGFLGGDLFVVANGLLLKEKRAFGLGYGLDLLGSFAGALAAAAFLIPLVGIPQVLKYLGLLNSFCFLFLVARWRR